MRRQDNIPIGVSALQELVAFLRKSRELLSFEVKLRFSEPADAKSVQRQHMEVQTFQYDVGQFKKVKNWRLDKDGRQHKRPMKFQLHRSSILALGCLHAVKEKVNGVCYGITRLNRFLSFFRLKFVLLKRERRCSRVAMIRSTSHETYFILERSLMALRINILSCVLSIAQLPALIFM